MVSLQKGYGHEQIEQNRERFELIEWSDPTDVTAEALVDTAAVMKNLDLVIAVDTSLAHLAGALGVKVWVAMPLASDWRWLVGREDTPWYPTMRLFRQRKLGEWGEVIERMAEALRGRPHPCPLPAGEGQKANGAGRRRVDSSCGLIRGHAAVWGRRQRLGEDRRACLNRRFHRNIAISGSLWLSLAHVFWLIMSHEPR